MHFVSFLFGLAAIATTILTQPLKVRSPRQITSTARALAGNLISTYYNSAENGVLPAPYAWWESGGLWATMIGYWSSTGDESYNSDIAAAIIAQAGSGEDFMGAWTTGNDDQQWVTNSHYHVTWGQGVRLTPG